MKINQQFSPRDGRWLLKHSTARGLVPVRYTAKKETVVKTIKILVFGLSLTTFTISQEIGITTSRLWTNNKELGNPNSFGIYLSKNLSNYFTLKLSYDYTFNEREYYGSLGSGMELNSVWEQIQTYADANLWKLTLGVIPYHSEIVSFNGGFTVSANAFEVDKKGIQTNKHNGETDGFKFGVGYVVLVQLFPIQSLPVSINVNASKEFMTQSFTMVTDVEQPFYNAIEISRIQIGIGYIIK